MDKKDFDNQGTGLEKDDEYCKSKDSKKPKGINEPSKVVSNQNDKAEGLSEEGKDCQGEIRNEDFENGDQENKNDESNEFTQKIKNADFNQAIAEINVISN